MLPLYDLQYAYTIPPGKNAHGFIGGCCGSRYNKYYFDSLKTINVFPHSSLPQKTIEDVSEEHYHIDTIKLSDNEYLTVFIRKEPTL